MIKTDNDKDNDNDNDNDNSNNNSNNKYNNATGFQRVACNSFKKLIN